MTINEWYNFLSVQNIVRNLVRRVMLPIFLQFIYAVNANRQLSD